MQSKLFSGFIPKISKLNCPFIFLLFFCIFSKLLGRLVCQPSHLKLRDIRVCRRRVFYHIKLILGKCKSNNIASWNDLVQILNIHSGNTGKVSRASVFEIFSKKLNMKNPVDINLWLCHLTCIFRIGVRSAIIIMLWSTSDKGKCINSYDSWIMHNIHLHEITCRNSDNYVPDDILQLQLVLHSVPFSIQTHTHIITGNQWNTRDKMCTSTHIPQSHHTSIKLQN